MNLADLFSKGFTNLTAAELKIFLADRRVESYTLLDVRQTKEYRAGHLSGAVLIPLPELPGRLAELDKTKPVVAYWAAGNRSRSAAKFLAGQGFKDVYNLLGGIRAWQGLAVKGLPAQGFEYLPRGGGAVEILAAVFGLEEGLKNYYRDLADSAESAQMAEAFEQLAELEDNHLKLIHHRCRELDPQTPELAEFAAQSSVPAVEGGLSLDRFAQLYRPVLDSPVRAVEMAMVFEAQALDLYSRFARAVEQGPARDLLLKLAEEERDHLKVLGRLMDGLV